MKLSGLVTAAAVAAVVGSAFSAEPTYEPIDLRSLTNIGFSDDVPGDGGGGWPDQGPYNDLRRFPTGRNLFAGVPFDIIDPAGNSGRSMLALYGVMGPSFPKSFTIPIGRKARTLFFLHCAAWAGGDNRVAVYRCRYADGTSVDIPISIGSEVVDWWGANSTEQAVLAWRGTNPTAGNIGVLLYPWPNPHPAKDIADVLLSSTESRPVYGLLALTVSDAAYAAPPTSPEELDHRGWIPYHVPYEDSEATALDCSSLLDGPCGRHGFLTARDGHFFFEDGTRARFFGVALSCLNAFPATPEMARTYAAHLAKRGFNVVRLSIIDRTTPKWQGGSVIDCGLSDTQHLHPGQMDRLDLLLSELKSRGIYVYMDLLTWRTFKEGDRLEIAEEFGVEPGSGCPAIFNRRLIELQKKYAHDLLTHLNPYTGLRYADDPTIALVELINESTLLSPGSLDVLSRQIGYREEITGLWNAWLVEEHGDREALCRVWGGPALEDAEDPQRGTVGLFSSVLAATGEGHGVATRARDAYRFLYSVERGYIREMRDYLRGLGLRVPICGASWANWLSSSSIHVEGDFVNTHMYWGRSRMGAFRQLTGPNLPLIRAADPTFAPGMSLGQGATAKVSSAPVVVSEWDFFAPYDYRCEGPLFLTAYAMLQDWDALIHWNYDTAPGPEGKEYLWFVFHMRNDPADGGLMPVASRMFLRGDVEKARHVVHHAISEAEKEGLLSLRGRSHPLLWLPYVFRVENQFFDNAYEGTADMVIPMGLSAGASYAAARHVIAVSEDALRLLSEVYPGVRVRRARVDLAFEGLIWPDRRLPADLDHAIELASIPSSATPIGVDSSAGVALGFVDERLCLIPDAVVLESAGDMSWPRNLYLDCARRWGLCFGERGGGASQTLASDTGQLHYDLARGLLTVDTPRTQAVVGYLAGGPQDLTNLRVLSSSPFAVVALTSLDDAPIPSSARLLVTAVARAENTGQKWLHGRELVVDDGGEPVLAEPVEADVRVKGLGCRGAQVYSLDAVGRRKGRSEAVLEGNDLLFHVGAEGAAIHYEIVLDRSDAP